MMQKLLDVKRKLKSIKPTFKRHDSHKKSRVSASWRRPKGRQNKQRLHRRGYAKGRSTGYGSPKAVYGLTNEGLRQVVVNSIVELKNLNPKEDGIIISRTLGNKKRSELIAETIKGNFKVLNLDVEKFQSALNAELKEKDSRKKALAKKRDIKEKEISKKKESKKKEEKEAEEKEESQSVEDKKISEKKEHDKILTQKGDQL